MVRASRVRSAACSVFFLGVFVAMSPLIGYSAPAGKPETVTWKLPYSGTPNLAAPKTFKAWGEVVTERTGGRFVVEPRSAAELNLGSAELLRMYGAGVVKIGELGGNYCIGDEPILAIGGLPFLYTSEEISNKLKALWPYAEQVFSKYNIKPLATFDFPNLLWAKTPINTMDDIKKLKLRTSSPTVSSLMSRLGGSAITLPAAEVYQALGTGIINSTTMGIDGGIGFGLPEVAKNVYLSPVIHGNFTYFVVNKDAFNSLPPDVQKVLVDTAKEFEPRFISAIRSVPLPKEARAKLEAKQVTIHEKLDPKLVDQIIRQAAIPLWDEWSSKHPGTKAAIDAVISSVGVRR